MVGSGNRASIAQMRGLGIILKTNIIALPFDWFKAFIVFASLVTALGMILRAIQNNDNIIARILAGIVGFLLWIYTAVAIFMLGAELAALVNRSRANPGRT